MPRMRGPLLRTTKLEADTETVHWLILLVPLAATFLLHNPTLNTALLTVLARALAMAGKQEDERTSEPA